jgi:hypothetical protein
MIAHQFSSTLDHHGLGHIANHLPRFLHLMALDLSALVETGSTEDLWQVAAEGLNTVTGWPPGRVDPLLAFL